MNESLDNRLHAALALLAAWLVVTSPWIAMLGRMPSSAGWLDRAHVAVGFATLLLALAYAWTCARQGRWRLYFPLTTSLIGGVTRDVGALRRGTIPAAEGGGLFGLIEGLALVALVVAGATGAAWFATQGSGEALAWRAFHLWTARALIGLLVLHVVTVSLHLLDFVRD